MQLIDTAQYTTTIFTFEDENGNEFRVTHNESFDDYLVNEWNVEHDGDDDEINYDTINSLIEMAQAELNK